MKQFAGGLNYYFANVQIQYGNEDAAKDMWKQIIAIEDAEQRHLAVDKLVDTAISNKEQNGFFAPDDEIVIQELLQRLFVIDDKTIYHLFFDTLKENIEQNPEQPSGFVIKNSIEQTLHTYFGQITNNAAKRNKIATVTFDKNDDAVIPSISNFKNQSCAACVEFASVSHNLWLLSGVTSYYVCSKDCAIDGSNEGHAFTVVEYGGSFKIFDMARGEFGRLLTNPIELIMKEKPLKIGNQIYAHASKIAEPTFES